MQNYKTNIDVMDKQIEVSFKCPGKLNKTHGNHHISQYRLVPT